MGLFDFNTWKDKAEKWVRGWNLLDQDKAAQINTDVENVTKRAIEITDDIKGWIQNPIEDFFVSMLPKWAQDAEGKLGTYIPIILAGLLSLRNPLGMNDALKTVKFSDNYYWDKFFHDLAVAIANVLSDGRIDFADLSVAIQFVKDHVGASSQLQK